MSFYRQIGWMVCACLIAAIAAGEPEKPRTFVHPGIPLTTTDLDAVKAHVEAGDYPWKQGFDLLAEDGHSQPDYKMRGPFEEVGRNIGGTGRHLRIREWRDDMTAVFNQSLMWYFTRNEVYAKNAHDILLAWAGTQKTYSGYEACLDLGDYAFRFAGGADILRGTWPGWTEADTRAVSNLFATVYWPASFGNGEALGPANKGALEMVSGLAIATFCDDTERFNQCLELFRSAGPTGLQNTLPTGQIGESLRDQGHAYGEWFSMAMMAEIFWKQGIDVYSELDRRLLAVGEYHARFNLGIETPSIPCGATDFYYLSNDKMSTWPHGTLGYTLIMGAYQVRMGMPTPFIDERMGELPISMEDFAYLKSADASTALPAPPTPVPATAHVTRNLPVIALGSATGKAEASYRDGAWLLTGCGENIRTDGDDSCTFAYLPVTNNAAVSAHVMAVGGRSEAVAGVMIRESLEADTPKAWVGINGEGQAEFYFSNDWTHLRGGGNWAKGRREIPSSDYWVKAERAGDRIALYIAPDGTSWACIGNAAFGNAAFGNLGDTAYIGLVVASGSESRSVESHFSYVCMIGGDGGEVPFVPAAPLSLLASPGTGCVPLRWLASAGAGYYVVQRADSERGVYRPIAKVECPSYIDTNVVAGQSYYYKVCAGNRQGIGEVSPGASAVPQAVRSAEPLKDGIYTITARHSGLRLEIEGRSRGDDAPIIQREADQSKYQQWAVRGIGAGNYQLVNVGSRMALDVKDDGRDNGCRIVQNPFSEGDPGQCWTIIGNGSGTYRILNTQSGKSLDVDGNSMVAGAVLNLWTFRGAGNQMFELKPVGP